MACASVMVMDYYLGNKGVVSSVLAVLVMPNLENDVYWTSLYHIITLKMIL